jgi:hypothetical protein
MSQAQDVRRFPWFAIALAALGSAGVAAAWVAASLLSGSQCAWMAVVAALDAAWLLRLAGAPRGGKRVAVAVLATLVAIVLANWGIVSAHLAGMMGLGFVDTALRLGPSLAWTLSALANTGGDLAWLAAGIVVAFVAAR